MQFDLVFEGGGSKGAVFIGALAEFEARGHTPGRIVGTSAGAITASLLAAGYSAQEARHAGYETTEFDMSPARFDALVEAGREAASEYFDRRELAMAVS